MFWRLAGEKGKLEIRLADCVVLGGLIRVYEIQVGLGLVIWAVDRMATLVEIVCSMFWIGIETVLTFERRWDTKQQAGY